MMGDVALVLALAAVAFAVLGDVFERPRAAARNEQEGQRDAERGGPHRPRRNSRLRALGRRAARSNSVPLTMSSRLAAHRLTSVGRPGARTSPATAPSSAMAIASPSDGQSAGTRAPSHRRKPNSRPRRRCASASSVLSPASLFSALSILSPSRRRARIASARPTVRRDAADWASTPAQEGERMNTSRRWRHDDRPGVARRPRRDRSVGSGGFHRRPPVAPVAARIHPRAAPAADRLPLWRAGRRLRPDVGAQGRPNGANLFARRRPRPVAPRRRPGAAAGLRALCAGARARGAAARGALRQCGGDRPLREDRVSPVRPLPRLLRGRRARRCASRSGWRRPPSAARLEASTSRRRRAGRLRRAASDAWCRRSPGARFASRPSRRVFAYRSAREPTGR